MKRKLKKLKNKLEKVNKELQKLPEGRLKRKGIHYYHVIGKKEFGITNDKKLIRKLCRKKHLLNCKKQLEHNIPIIARHFNKFDDTTEEEMIDALSNTYQGLPRFYFFHSSVEDWMAKAFEKNPFSLNKKEGYTTKNGVTVRSKSEFIIACLLEYYGIPYRYEAAVYFDEQYTKYPDFTIMNPFTGKLIIWEHFGATNESGYVESMNDKMNLYMRHGYVPFENLICTFESDIGDPGRLEVFIETIILKA